MRSPIEASARREFGPRAGPDPGTWAVRAVRIGPMRSEYPEEEDVSLAFPDLEQAARVAPRPPFPGPTAMRLSNVILATGVAVALAVTTTRCAPAEGPVSPAPAKAMVADRLFFGRAIPGGGLVSEEAWASFLAEVVTPRFSEGLTVWRAEGQWTDPRGQLVRESVQVVEVIHPAGPRADSSLAAIAREYKRRFHQGAVLRVTTPALGHLY